MIRRTYTSLTTEMPKVRYCAKCGCRIPLSASHEICRECLKKELFPQVKEFINSTEGDVNELMISEQLGIDRSLIHDWIREGFLEYKKEALNVFREDYRDDF